VVDMVKVVRLRRGAEKQVLNGLLTIYSKWIEDDGGAEPGEDIILVDSRRKTIGIGFYEGIGAVGVRLLKIGAEEDVSDIIRRNILYAYRKREFYPFDSKRIVNADADHLPGLIIDLYKDTAVIQSSSIGMDNRLDLIAMILRRSGIANYVYVRNDQRSRMEIGLERWRGWMVKGDETVLTIREGKAIFKVDIEEGQKTGFYLDQRINRLEAGLYTSNKKVLDLYSYTGGFGIQALVNNAKKTVFVEETPRSIELLYENLKINDVLEKSEVYEGRVEKFLDESGGKFDVIISDPPALVQNRASLDKGVNKYRKVLKDIVKHISQGILFVSSCSYFITPEILKREIIDKILEENRRRYLYLGMVRGAAPDHMHRSIDKELRYLKGYFLYIH